jgi:hypothetical protein
MGNREPAGRQRSLQEPDDGHANEAGSVIERPVLRQESAGREKAALSVGVRLAKALSECFP